MNRDQVLAELQALKLTSGQYVVVGGAALAIRDIRDTEDIDLVVTPQLFDELAARGWQPKARPSGKPGLKFARAEAYLDVNCEAFGQSTSWLLEHAERVHDTLLVDLPTLAQFKAGYGRDKDVRDLQLISEHCPSTRRRGKENDAATGK
jgi:hypothetical protein